MGLKNHNAHGGFPVHDIFTVAGCSDLCRETAMCVGFDWDLNDPPYQDARCWIHNELTYIEVVEQVGVTHYSRVPCPFSSGRLPSSPTTLCTDK